MSSIGKSIRSIRLWKALSQTEISKKTGISTNTLSQIELGKTMPSDKSLTKISMALEVDKSLIFANSLDVDSFDTDSKKLVASAAKRLINQLILSEWK